MTTQETVDRLLELIAQGKNVEAEQELYAQDVVSFEQDGRSATGLDAVIAKTKAAQEYFEEFYGGGVKTAYVGAKDFLLHFEMDVKPKGGERMTMVEFGFYKLNDEGKVSEEYFYMTPRA